MLHDDYVTDPNSYLLANEFMVKGYIFESSWTEALKHRKKENEINRLVSEKLLRITFISRNDSDTGTHYLDRVGDCVDLTPT